MPLDENFPIFLFSHDDPKRARHITAISSTISGSPPNPVYTYTRAPSARNTYTAQLTDALFPSITYATIITDLEIPPPSPGTPLPAELKVLLPAEFTLNLYNPDSSVIFELHASTLRGNYWEFTLPKRSFHPPSNSLIDAHYDPIPSERLTFRWRKEGGALTRKQLRCYLVSPGNLPGPGGRKTKKGAGEPDIPVAMFEGLGEKSGRGELTLYESNFRRMEVQDLKGLEMVLVMGARIVNDVYFCRTREMFNTEGEVMAGVGKPRGGSAVVVPQVQAQQPPIPQIRTQQQQPPPGYYPPEKSSHQPGHYPPEKPSASSSSPSTPQPHPQSFAARMQHHQQTPSHPRPPHHHQPTPPSPSTEARIAHEQAQIRAMLAREEADRINREKSAIDAETERLRRLYLPQQQQPQSVRRSSHPPPGHGDDVPPVMPPRPSTTVPAQGRRPSQTQRPPIVGGGGGGLLVVPGMNQQQGLRHARRKSFLGLFGMDKELGAGGGGQDGKLRKKSSFWS
ncbi:hypothetical protein EX30DRAFT_157158 [Ascodesmis nigricans]|uniref:Uncharacterized protein n=1 Tax=Ascodesmis nigricans TaxID=341454 RepID=A0A4V3SI22_9PEZI|nr:hypothetical protein EX30DRAFT_157158 [Ascodesmis nigricans]